MVIKFPYSPNIVRLALLIFFGSVFWVGIQLATYFEPVYFTVFFGTVTVLVSACIQFEWLTLGIDCPNCESLAPLKFEYLEGPVGSRTYMVAACSGCRESTII